MNLTLFISMLFALQLFYWMVGRLSSKKVANQQDYFLAGKTVGFFPLMMTFVGVIVGGGVVLGSAEEAYRYGWSVFLFPLGSALGLIMLGTGIGRRLAQFPVSTVAQILEIVYGSTRLKKIASLLSVTSLFLILVGQVIASSKFLVSLGIESTSFLVLFWAVIFFYTIQGGLKAVISTDVAQASLFASVFLGCFVYVFYTEPQVSHMPPFQLGSLALVSPKIIGWLLMPSFFMVIEQDIAQRCFAGSSSKVVTRAALVAGVCTIFISIVPVFFGVLASSMQLIVPKGGSVLMSAIISTTNPVVASLVGCAILAAIVSTASALINAISSNLASDFNFYKVEEKGSLATLRLLTMLISVFAILFAFYFDSIVDILIQSYELSVSGLFVPVFLALFSKKGNGISAWLALLGGALGFVLLRLFPIEIPKEMASILLSLLGYLFGEGLVFLQTKRRANMLLRSGEVDSQEKLAAFDKIT